MSNGLDRERFIELFERLGDENDEEVLKAAREIHGRVSDAGASWDELLVPEEPPETEPEEEEGEEAPAEPAAAPRHAMADEEALDLIERLLVKKDILDETREELREYKKDIAANDFDEGDRKYLRALYARLAKRK